MISTSNLLPSFTHLSHPVLLYQMWTADATRYVHALQTHILSGMRNHITFQPHQPVEYLIYIVVSAMFCVVGF